MTPTQPTERDPLLETAKLSVAYDPEIAVLNGPWLASTAYIMAASARDPEESRLLSQIGRAVAHWKSWQAFNLPRAKP